MRLLEGGQAIVATHLRWQRRKCWRRSVISGYWLWKMDENIWKIEENGWKHMENAENATENGWKYIEMEETGWKNNENCLLIHLFQSRSDMMGTFFLDDQCWWITYLGANSSQINWRLLQCSFLFGRMILKWWVFKKKHWRVFFWYLIWLNGDSWCVSWWWKVINII